ncbi:hypothetical protein CALCODRAFT_471825 [Calocera cornea HHB12733]|uniref:Cytochrome P450 n=1 Tax=Calocera cornea HHB12733 TaxID=1353952 RepID=A0A165EZ68_9BASI|nr:hypothetical protein CALCODRAFT_471825 [Calocera cornea HHB12733]
MLSLIFASLIGFVVLGIYWSFRPSRLPPGPRGIPFLGNALDIPLKGLFLKIEDWKRTHGDTFSLNAAGQNILVLASAKAAAHVLDKMSGPTSARPRFTMVRIVLLER